MPVHYQLPSFRDTKRWLNCMREAAKLMIAQGRNKHARKFNMVQQRRALQLYRNS